LRCEGGFQQRSKPVSKVLYLVDALIIAANGQAVGLVADRIGLASFLPVPVEESKLSCPGKF
jgi:hypothetical protein